MKITKHAQSCLFIETKQRRILIDAGTYVFSEEGLGVSDFKNIDILAYTHEHFDHFDFDNAVEIIKAENPIIFCPQSIAEQLQPHSDKICILSQNFKFKQADINIERFVSQHGPLPTGAEPPEVSGIVVDDGDHRLYTPGDSIYLDQETRADIIAVPICGQVVMDIEQAKSELLKLKPVLAIPIHYDSPRYPVNVDDFAESMKDTDIKIAVLEWGKSILV